MVRTIEEEEAAKALTSKNQNKCNTAVTSRNVSATTKPQEEAEKASKIQNNGNTAASLSTVNTVMERQKENLLQKSHAASSVTRKLRSSTQVQEEEKL